MNPIKLLKIYKRANLFFSLLEEASVSKSLFKSKIFWVNILTAANELLGVVPIPHAIGALAVVNIALRLITRQPVHMIPPGD